MGYQLGYPLSPRITASAGKCRAPLGHIAGKSPYCPASFRCPRKPEGCKCCSHCQWLDVLLLLLGITYVRCLHFRCLGQFTSFLACQTVSLRHRCGWMRPYCVWFQYGLHWVCRCFGQSPFFSSCQTVWLSHSP
jgi:hypothetical protein